MDDIYTTNLEKKLENPPELAIFDAFCIWTDLLGFGSQFYESNWHPSRKQWEKIRNRLLNAHTIAIRESSTNERLLILNDGIARVTGLVENPFMTYLLQLSIFIRGGVLTHLRIKESEKEEGYPGARTVIAAGKGALYMAEEINVDDFFYNYTKPDPKGLSRSAQEYGNPAVVYNPMALQMNTAFSKAYILESGGKKAGLPGCGMYVDDSFIQLIKQLANQEEDGYLWEENEDFIEFTVPRKATEGRAYKEEDVVIGFRLSKPITPEGVPWKTTVYRILRYYPWDELSTEFYFDLEEKTVANSIAILE